MREILTARDIEDLAAQGVREIPLSEGVILTDVAREMAAVLGITLLNAASAGRGTQPGVSEAPAAARASPVEASAAVGPLGSHPKGCLHSHLEGQLDGGRATGGGTGPAITAGGSSGRSVVDQLVEAVRRMRG